MIKKKLILLMWIAVGILTVVLLGAAMQKKNEYKCKDIKIEIVGSVQHMFVDEKDILQTVNSIGLVTGNSISNINLRNIELLLEKNAWIKNAEVYFNNNNELIINIEEKEPVARIFTLQESSFYVDTLANQLPISDKYSARVPVFTAFPTDHQQLSMADSLLMVDVIKLAKFIQADSFWNAQIAQVNILPNATFEIIPVLGNQIISLGNADELDKKFKRLLAFYKYAWLQNGINKYERLNVEFNNQVVAIKKGVSVFSDTTKAKQIIITVDSVKAETINSPKAVFKKN
ncbi:MAG TPA: hypothetical protein PLU36_04795 [Chitinophagaceae bacterium]|nr:hypothetical protein [Chitinophagaceae bacterium]HMZ46099.1 hypothetical protein [Chitinophagaceae bacterium]